MDAERFVASRKIARHATAVTLTMSFMLMFSCGAPSKSPVAREDDNGSLVARAMHFRALVAQEDYRLARALMAADPIRWWGNRDDGGQPWTIGKRTPGPWSDWDGHFRSEKTIMGWREGPNHATATIRETNDYYRLLHRGWVTNEATYFFDEAGRIEGLLIRAVGERPRGLTDEFLEWARANDPEELEELMPGGEIDPSGDHPRRFRRLLNRWRRASGLELIE